ncbi:MAG: hypothetical protein JSS07_09765 [Proteobacteria bacterium]|nr:hypothetical protein [Pseudomonadota bacterium]
MINESNNKNWEFFVLGGAFCSIFFPSEIMAILTFLNKSNLISEIKSSAGQFKSEWEFITIFNHLASFGYLGLLAVTGISIIKGLIASLASNITIMLWCYLGKKIDTLLRKITSPAKPFSTKKIILYTLIASTIIAYLLVKFAL